MMFQILDCVYVFLFVTFHRIDRKICNGVSNECHIQGYIYSSDHLSAIFNSNKQVPVQRK